MEKVRSAWYYQSTSKQAILEDLDEELWLSPPEGPPCTKKRMIPYNDIDPRRFPERFKQIPPKYLKQWFQLELLEEEHQEKKDAELELEP